jgi:hypothetical protein
MYNQPALGMHVEQSRGNKSRHQIVRVTVVKHLVGHVLVRHAANISCWGLLCRDVPQRLQNAKSKARHDRKSPRKPAGLTVRESAA